MALADDKFVQAEVEHLPNQRIAAIKMIDSDMIKPAPPPAANSFFMRLPKGRGKVPPFRPPMTKSVTAAKVAALAKKKQENYLPSHAAILMRNIYIHDNVRQPGLQDGVQR